jgi:hypothetical protein
MPLTSEQFDSRIRDELASNANSTGCSGDKGAMILLRANKSIFIVRRQLRVTGGLRDYVGITTGVPQIADDSLHSSSRRSRAKKRHCPQFARLVASRVSLSSIATHGPRSRTTEQAANRIAIDGF